MSSGRNPGNFLALLKVFAETDPVLQSHLRQPRLRNATYLSPRIQNEIISIIGYDILQAGIVRDIKDSLFFSVLADEVASHNVEHLALCLRFVDQSCDIREEFVAFVKLQRVRASDISSAILGCLDKIGLPISGLRGQGYDGASAMSGEKSGVQKLIIDKQPKAFYTHCAGHSLNLVVVKACAVPAIRNCIASIKNFTIWVKYSPKREALLKAITERSQQQGISRSRTPLINVCITRWVENIDGWERFCQAHPSLVEMCEVILYGDASYNEFNDGWTAEDKHNAMAHLKVLESFEFIYTLVVLQRTLLYFRQAAVQLQGKSEDIASGVALVQDCLGEVKNLRFAGVSDYSRRVFEHASRIAAKSDIAVSMPRVSKRQQHRSNVPADTPEEYMQRSVLIPFLDHLIMDMNSRFEKHVEKASKIEGLLPTKLSPETTFDSIREAVELYSSDLPDPEVVDEEFSRWKSKWTAVLVSERPASLQDCLKACSPDRFPNLFTLLKLFAVLPLSSASCERSASSLRRLNTYLRCSQTEERLTSLALIHADSTTDVDAKQVCKLFVEKHPRRLQGASLLFD